MKQIQITEDFLKNNGFEFGEIETDDIFLDDKEYWHIEYPEFNITISFPKNLDLMDSVDEMTDSSDDYMSDPYGDAGIEAGEFTVDFKEDKPYHYMSFFWEEGLTKETFLNVLETYESESYKEYVEKLFE